MENYSYSSYPDSRDSSPRSREIDLDHQSWEDQQNPNPNYKVKFMCSYGGKIHPRPHDHQLSYVGGDTKILSVERSVKFSPFLSKLSSLCGADSLDLCFKYQLPGEDLDALISVTNDEDLDHMMTEYDRLHRASPKPARLRLFLFPLNPSSSSFDPKSERQWFVDALNSVQIQPLDDASSQGASAAEASNPDFLFGFDKPGKLQDAPPPPKVVVKDATAGSDCGSEDRHLMVEPPAEMQRQIQDFQRMQISTHEQACQAMFNRTPNDEGVPRTFPGEFYPQKAPEGVPPSAAQPPIPVPVPMPIPASYYPDRHMTTAGTEQPVYFIPSMYQQAPPTMRTVTGQMGQAYYGMQRMAAPPPEVYRDQQPLYNAMQQPQQKVGVYNEGIGMVQQQKVAVAVPEQGYAQVGYDSSGRQVYYTTAGGMVPQGGIVPQQYQVAAAAAVVDGRQGGGTPGGGATMNQEGKVAVKTPQSPV